jgi:hypothetical protein
MALADSRAPFPRCALIPRVMVYTSSKTYSPSENTVLEYQEGFFF